MSERGSEGESGGGGVAGGLCSFRPGTNKACTVVSTVVQ